MGVEHVLQSGGGARMSPPQQDGQGDTHWDTCWQDPAHHACAVQKVLAMDAALKAMQERIDELTGEENGSEEENAGNP